MVQHLPIMLLALTVASCNSADVNAPSNAVPDSTQALVTDPSTGSENTPRVEPISTQTEATSSAPLDNAPDYNPTAPADGLQTEIVLNNPSAELTLAMDDQATATTIPTATTPDGTTTPGWQGNENCSVTHNNSAAGNGLHTFELGTGCELQQLTDVRYRTGDGVSVLFDASAMESDQLSVELLSLSEQNSVKVVAQQTITFGPGSQKWKPYQTLMKFGVADAVSGEKFGIRFRHPDDDTATNPIAIDAITANLFQAAPIAMTAAATTASATTTPTKPEIFSDTWSNVCDQIWAGEHYWANRLRDWHVLDGKVQTRNVDTFRPMRTLHRVATVLSETPSDFQLQIDTGVSTRNGGNALHGLLLGAGTRMDYRGAALVHNRSGLNGGIVLAIDAEGRAIIRDNGIGRQMLARGNSGHAIGVEGARLVLDASYENSGDYHLQLSVLAKNGGLISSADTRVNAARVLGNVALIANPGSEQTIHWFNNFSGSGGKLREVAQREFGPVLFTSYTVSRDVLTLNAQYPPVCSSQTGVPELQLAEDGQWQTVATAQIDPQSYTALFRIENWDASRRAHYRISTTLDRTLDKASDSTSDNASVNTQNSDSDATSTSDSASNKSTLSYSYRGTIQADPIDSDEFVIGVFNCRPGVVLSDEEGWIQQNNSKPFTWTRERIVVPHEELLANAAKHQSHMITFLGDQIYEFDPNGFIDKTSTEATIEDYFWKWYQFGWAVRDYTRNTPSFILPDDHDVFQGNVWGQGGRAAATENEGGFVFPAEFVQIVQRTQTGSLPPAFDPTPVEQGIDVYYTDLVYGGIGIAVLEDRKFKTGPDSPEPDKKLLGERQLDFLDAWARDWKGQSMKVAISQSPFSQSTTHSGKGFQRIGHDLDSNGWPKTGRDKAVAALRRAYAPHISGDQHLGMSLQHGIDDFNDAVYSFSGPSMLNIFPRIWDPRNPGNGPGDPTAGYRGNWTDKHGNLISIFAAANPATYYQPVADPSVEYTVAAKDDLGIGYGLVRINKASQEYTFEAWPANQDPDNPQAKPYQFWPVTIKQTDNDGRLATGVLPAHTAPVNNPVVEVVDEQTGELIYARRFTTAVVEATVYNNNTTYTLNISDPESGYVETFSGLQAQ